MKQFREVSRKNLFWDFKNFLEIHNGTLEKLSFHAKRQYFKLKPVFLGPKSHILSQMGSWNIWMLEVFWKYSRKIKMIWVRNLLKSAIMEFNFPLKRNIWSRIVIFLGQNLKNGVKWGPETFWCWKLSGNTLGKSKWFGSEICQSLPLWTCIFTQNITF